FPARGDAVRAAGSLRRNAAWGALGNFGAVRAVAGVRDAKQGLPGRLTASSFLWQNTQDGCRRGSTDFVVNHKWRLRPRIRQGGEGEVLQIPCRHDEESFAFDLRGGRT